MVDIYELLKSGRTSDDIVAEFTRNLNEAEIRLEMERQAEAKAAEERAAAKAADFRECVKKFMLAVGTHYPEVGVNTEDVSDAVCDAIADLVIMALDNEANRAKVKVTARKKLPVDMKIMSTDDIFADFFKTLGI